MGLLSRIEEERMRSFMEESAAVEKVKRAEQARERQRIEIVDCRVERFASDVGETLEQLTRAPVGQPRYYIVGDLILMVRRFATGKEQPDPSKPLDVTYSYCVYLACLNHEKKLRYRKIGALRFLNYDGLYKTVSEAPPNWLFDAAAVKVMLDE